jgi:hypothetical protein
MQGLEWSRAQGIGPPLSKMESLWCPICLGLYPTAPEWSPHGRVQLLYFRVWFLMVGHTISILERVLIGVATKELYHSFLYIYPFCSLSHLEFGQYGSKKQGYSPLLPVSVGLPFYSLSQFDPFQLPISVGLPSMPVSVLLPSTPLLSVTPFYSLSQLDSLLFPVSVKLPSTPCQ